MRFLILRNRNDDDEAMSDGSENGYAIISGSLPGRRSMPPGPRPTCIVADELWRMLAHRQP